MFNDLRLDWTARVESVEEQEGKVESGIRPIRTRGRLASGSFCRTTGERVSNVSLSCDGPDIGYPYELLEKIGTGAMGDIWRAHDMKLMRDVAIKVAHGSLGAESPFDEARLAARAEHPNVVRIYDVGLTRSGTSYLVMELLTGEDLEARLARKPGPVDSDEAVQLAIELLSGLDAVHGAKVVHRDIKPSNVFLSEVGDQTVVKLLDFGVACQRRREQGGLAAGTPMYMAPEQLLAGARASVSTDIYSVGVLLFQLIFGQNLSRVHWAHASMYEIAQSRDVSPLKTCCDPALAFIIECALAENPGERFSSAREFRQALMDWRGPASGCRQRG